MMKLGLAVPHAVLSYTTIFLNGWVGSRTMTTSAPPALCGTILPERLSGNVTVWGRYGLFVNGSLLVARSDTLTSRFPVGLPFASNWRGSNRRTSARIEYMV